MTFRTLLKTMLSIEIAPIFPFFSFLVLYVTLNSNASIMCKADKHLELSLPLDIACYSTSQTDPYSLNMSAGSVLETLYPFLEEAIIQNRERATQHAHCLLEQSK